MFIDKEYVQENNEYSLDSSHEYFKNVDLDCICEYPKIWLDEKIHALYEERPIGFLEEQNDLLSFLIECESTKTTDTTYSLERGRICRLSLINFSGINLLILYVAESNQSFELWSDTALFPTFLDFGYSLSESEFHVFPFSPSEEDEVEMNHDGASVCAERIETWLNVTLKSITNCPDFLVPEWMIGK